MPPACAARQESCASDGGGSGRSRPSTVYAALMRATCARRLWCSRADFIQNFEAPARRECAGSSHGRLQTPSALVDVRVGRGEVQHSQRRAHRHAIMRRSWRFPRRFRRRARRSISTSSPGRTWRGAAMSAIWIWLLPLHRMRFRASRLSASTHRIRSQARSRAAIRRPSPPARPRRRRPSKRYPLRTLPPSKSMWPRTAKVDGPMERSVASIAEKTAICVTSGVITRS